MSEKWTPEQTELASGMECVYTQLQALLVRKAALLAQIDALDVEINIYLRTDALLEAEGKKMGL